MRPTQNKELEKRRDSLARDIATFKKDGGKITVIPFGQGRDTPTGKHTGGKKPKVLSRKKSLAFFKMYYNGDSTLQEVADKAGMTRACLQKNWRRYGMSFNNKSTMNTK